MGTNKKTLISIGAQFAVAVVIALLVAYLEGLSFNTAGYLNCHYLCDGFFISAVIFIGIGGLLWISNTGFFDIFGYAFKSIVHLLTPSKYDEEFPRYFDYKSEQNDKREGKPLPHTMLFVGLIVLAMSIALLMLYYRLMPTT